MTIVEALTIAVATEAAVIGVLWRKLVKLERRYIAMLEKIAEIESGKVRRLHVTNRGYRP